MVFFIHREPIKIQSFLKPDTLYRIIYRYNLKTNFKLYYFKYYRSIGSQVIYCIKFNKLTKSFRSLAYAAAPLSLLREHLVFSFYNFSLIFFLITFSFKIFLTNFLRVLSMCLLLILIHH